MRIVWIVISTGFLLCVSCRHIPSDADASIDGTIQTLRKEMLKDLRAAFEHGTPGVVEAFQAADRLLGEGKMKEANLAYKQLLRCYPSGPQVRWAEFWMGYTAEQIGDLKEAKACYHVLANFESDIDILPVNEATKRFRAMEMKYPNLNDGVSSYPVLSSGKTAQPCSAADSSTRTNAGLGTAENQR